MKLDISKEKNKLSTKYKKLWEFKEVSIEELYKEGKLDDEQKEAMLQTQLAATRVADLKEQNEYNAKSNDVFAQRAIKKNQVEINKLGRYYNDNSKIIGETKIKKIETEIDNRTVKKIQKHNEKNKGKKQ